MRWGWFAAISLILAIPVALGLGKAVLLILAGHWEGFLLLGVVGPAAYGIARLLHSYDPLHWNERPIVRPRAATRVEAAASARSELPSEPHAGSPAAANDLRPTPAMPSGAGPRSVMHSAKHTVAATGTGLAAEFKRVGVGPATDQVDRVKHRLADADRLRDEGAISAEEYAKLRERILAEL